MHESFAAFVQHGRALAAEKGLGWELALDGKGKTASGWNLTAIAGALPPAMYLRDFGQENKILQLLNAKQAERGIPALATTALSPHWQDLLKAAACDQLLFRRNTPGHVASNVVRPLKVLATCAGDLEPWQLTVDVIREAVALARESQPSGKLADLVLGVTNTVIDANRLAEACPLYAVVSLARREGGDRRKSRAAKSKEQLLDDLEQRKRAERLPEKRAFWELIRIIFTEPPQSFADALRFAALKTLVLCGLRVGEALLLPADWQRYRDYYDAKGRPAGALGGYSRSLLLRHFAEKQQTPQSDSTVLFETTQPIPEMFEEILTETLDEVARLTAPLRETLRLQVQTGRLLPWYQPHDLVPVTELYPRLTGNPIWLDLPAETVDGHRVTISANIEKTDEIKSVLKHGAEGIGLYRTEFLYFNRSTLPTEEEHYETYRSVAQKMLPNSVIIRTMDIGGDKLAHLGLEGFVEEKNPFMGLRAIRFCLKFPQIFKTQLRGILRASADGQIKILFPMISCLSELRAANKILAEVKEELRREGKPFDEKIEVGSMIEVPSAAIISDLIARECDFLSIGTNDLIQYTLAVDRVNENVALLYDPLHLSILRLLKMVIDAGHAAGKWVGMCGEMAGDPNFVKVLVGLGLDEFSMAAVQIPKIKKITRSLYLAEAKVLVGEIFGPATDESVADMIRRHEFQTTKN